MSVVFVSCAKAGHPVMPTATAVFILPPLSTQPVLSVGKHLKLTLVRRCLPAY